MIKVTLEIQETNLTKLQDFLLNLDGVETVEPKPKKAAEELPKEEITPKSEVTKAMIRARGVELSKERGYELEAVFKKFGANHIKEIKEEDYEAVYEELGKLLGV